MFSNPQMLSVVPRGCHFVAWYYIWQPANQPWKGHFWVASRLCFKARLSTRPLIWKWFFILMKIKLIFTTKVLQLAWFWKWEFLELAKGLPVTTSKFSSVITLHYFHCEQNSQYYMYMYKLCTLYRWNNMSSRSVWVLAMASQSWAIIKPIMDKPVQIVYHPCENLISQ